jgi:hypothetical protein
MVVFDVNPTSTLLNKQHCSQFNNGCKPLKLPAEGLVQQRLFEVVEGGEFVA